MTLTITLCKGLPASGKSIWAQKQIQEHPDQFKGINRDFLREMIDAKLYSAHREEFIRKAELMLAELYLDAGYHIIVYDTNLSPSAQTMWIEFAKQKKALVLWKDFTDVPLEECIARDLKRPNSVGERVIRDMYSRYIAPKKEVLQAILDPTLPEAFICDLDGTLALFNGRGPYESEKCETDLLNEAVALIVRQSIVSGLLPIFTSGRSDEFRVQTERWLTQHGFTHSLLLMRSAGDKRKDALVKRELYDEHIRGKYGIHYVLEDRSQVVAVWRSLGLVCLQVADGEY